MKKMKSGLGVILCLMFIACSGKTNTTGNNADGAGDTGGGAGSGDHGSGGAPGTSSGGGSTGSSSTDSGSSGSSSINSAGPIDGLWESRDIIINGCSHFRFTIRNDDLIFTYNDVGNPDCQITTKSKVRYDDHTPGYAYTYIFSVEGTPQCLGESEVKLFKETEMTYEKRNNVVTVEGGPFGRGALSFTLVE